MTVVSAVINSTELSSPAKAHRQERSAVAIDSRQRVRALRLNELRRLD